MEKIKPLNKYEKELFESLENLYIKKISIGKREYYVKKAKLLAKKHFAKNLKKDKLISLRLNSDLLDLVKKRARLENVPYQTKISSLLYKYAIGEVS